MVAGDAAEVILQAADRREDADERYRKQLALIIAVLAMLLAMATLGGDNASREAVNSNVLAADYWVYSHTQGLHAASLRLARDNLEIDLSRPDLAPASRAQIERRIASYTDAITRLEADPGAAGNIPGVVAQAQALEARRDRALAREPNFDYAQGLYQIAIVLGSVGIASASRLLRPLVLALGVAATLLLLNAYLLIL